MDTESDIRGSLTPSIKSQLRVEEDERTDVVLNWAWSYMFAPLAADRAANDSANGHVEVLSYHHPIIRLFLHPKSESTFFEWVL